MTRQEKEAVVGKLFRLAFLLGVDVKEERLFGYVDSLNDLNISAVLDGVDSVIKSWKYPHFPNIADIREAAGCVDGGNPVEARAVAAWTKLRGKLGQAYDRTGFADDPIAKKVFNAMGGGYTTPDGFGRWSTEQDPWKRKEFIRLYMEAAKVRAVPQEMTDQARAGVVVEWPRRGALGGE